MGEETKISWAHSTFNLWIGCWKIDPECENCYAAATDNQRWGGEHWGRKAPRKWTGDAYWKQLAKWNRAAKSEGVRKRVFVGSLMDWAETHPVAEIQAEMDRRRARFWDLVKACPQLDFLMLTKRIEDVPRYLPWYYFDGIAHVPRGPSWFNVWIGTTAGTIKTLREHAAALRKIHATVRFISGEPLLEDIPRADWDAALGPELDYSDGGIVQLYPIDWLILGAESGGGRRPMQHDWVRTARDAAIAHGVKLHYKQDVDFKSGKKTHLPVIDGRSWAEFPER